MILTAIAITATVAVSASNDFAEALYCFVARSSGSIDY